MSEGEQTSWTRRAALGAGGLGLLGTAACGAKPTPRDEQIKDGPFQHGIASGDPLQTRVILWTCISGTGGGYVGWEISKDQDFGELAGSGQQMVGQNGPTPIKMDVGGLQPGTEYFYRFTRNDVASAIGRTKTLPQGKVDEIALAVVSCSNLPSGYFHSYAHLAASEPVDAVLALGDYIYEYGLGGYGTDDAEALGRVPEPVYECLSYADYAMRYAQYHRDPDLQAAHAIAPWIMTWDDHETANDSFKGGAQNHSEDEGDWATREAASLKAFYDWTPTREPAVDQPRSAFWRRFDFGDLASLTMIETRLSGRSKQITFDEFPVSVDADPDDPEVQAKLEHFEKKIIGRADRRMLGDAQAAFVGEALQSSVASGQAWQIIGNQTLFTETRSPNFMTSLPGWLKFVVRQTSDLFYGYFQRSRFHPLLNLDSWDGYPAARERFYDKVKSAGANMLVVTGDTHDFTASRLRDADGTKVGVELGTSGVSSPGNYSTINAPGVNFGTLTEKQNPDVILHDTSYTGYIRMKVTRQNVLADYIATSSVKVPKWTAETEYQFKVTKADIEQL